jgi:hypothetical protein
MIKVNATIKVEFEVEESDKDSVLEALTAYLEDAIVGDELWDHTKLKYTDLEDDEEEPDFEEE